MPKRLACACLRKEPAATPTAPSHASHRIVIEAGRLGPQYWRDLWRYRELFAFLTWRDVAVRYRQTVVGVLWAVVQPVVSMLVLTFIFGRLAKMPSPEGVPHAIMTFAGTMPWLFFAAILTACGQSMTANARLVTKVYFPRLMIPLSCVGVALVDFLVAFAVFGGLCALLGYVPSWRIVFVPAFLALAAAAAFSIGIWFAALNVRYRDFRYVVPFAVQFGLYISPVGYLSSSVDGSLRFFYHLNPMANVIDGFRWAILGTGEFHAAGAAASAAIVAVLLGGGLHHFRRAERMFADVI